MIDSLRLLTMTLHKIVEWFCPRFYFFNRWPAKEIKNKMSRVGGTEWCELVLATYGSILVGFLKSLLLEFPFSLFRTVRLEKKDKTVQVSDQTIWSSIFQPLTMNNYNNNTNKSNRLWSPGRTHRANWAVCRFAAVLADTDFVLIYSGYYYY